VIGCRVCGHCGAAHSTAATAALASAFGTVAPPNGVLCRNVVLAAEMLLDHLTHFYLSFMVDFASPPYPEPLGGRFRSLRGESVRRFVRARSQFLALLGLFAGKWPNTLALQPGGTTKVVSEAEVLRALGVQAEFAAFLRDQTFGCPPEEWLSVASVADLDAWLADGRRAESDAGAFLRLAREAGLETLGRGPGRFLSAGAFPSADGGPPALRAGFFDGEYRDFDPAPILERIRRDWEREEEPRPPGDKRPGRAADPPTGGPSDPLRFGGRAVEVGPQARQVIQRDPLALDWLRARGPSALSREVFRLREAAWLSCRLRSWIEAVRPREPFFVKEQPRDGEAFGFAPSPRGTLVHGVEIRGGSVAHYRILTPTEWNFSATDAAGGPGPVEEALAGTPVEDPGPGPRVAHVIQSFNPCVYCMVH
jgi:hydrogenase large subunit